MDDCPRRRECRAVQVPIKDMDMTQRTLFTENQLAKAWCLCIRSGLMAFVLAASFICGAQEPVGGNALPTARDASIWGNERSVPGLAKLVELRDANVIDEYRRNFKIANMAIHRANGEKPYPLLTPPDKLERYRTHLRREDFEFAQMFRPPFLPADELLPLVHPDLPTAKAALLAEIDQFYVFFKENPDACPQHPFYGNLNLEDWEVFHSKHFYHHFKQFGLVG